MLLGAILLAGAVLLIRENHIEEVQAGSDAAAVLTALQQEMTRENSALLLPNESLETDLRTQQFSGEASEAELQINQYSSKASEISKTSSYEIFDTNMPTSEHIERGDNSEEGEISSEYSAIGTPSVTGRPVAAESSSIQETIASPIQSTPSPASSSMNTSPSSTLLPEMPTLQIGKQSYIGYIELPTLGLSLPVMSEWSYPKLRISPCRYTGSVYDDSLVILAHNYTRHFGGIKDLAIGDPVQFVDADGNIYQYTVAKHETLDKKDVREMVDNEYDLTLFTCTYGGKNRVTVRLIRVRSYE